MLGVLRRNPEFRRLWLAQVVSEAGDWLDRIAVLSLIGSLGGGGVGVLFGVEVATRLLPTALMGPLAGPVADRLPRRALMIASDLARALVVLALLLVDGPEDLPLLYTLVASQMAISIFFQSARSACVPRTVPKEDLHAAYALTAVTWSSMLSVGALLGGVLVTWIGTSGVFVVDALTYVASAVLLLRLDVGPPPEHPEPFRWSRVLKLEDMRDGLRHVRARGLLPAVLAKAFWGGAGGYLVVLSLAAHERFGDAQGAGASLGTALGLLYAARGVGTGLGPVLARRWLGSGERALRLQVGGGFFVGAIGYLCFAPTTELGPAIALVVLAHMGGSSLWVASTILWQVRVDDRFRGRVYALEFLSMTLAFSVGALVSGHLHDLLGNLTATVVSVSALVSASGLAWIAFSSATLRREARAAPGEPLE